jgi:replication factor A1
MNHKRDSEGESLAVLSAKHSVDPDSLFEALVSTREKQKNMCGNLSIECRGSSGGRRIFLLKDATKVVAQVKVNEAFLSEKTNPISKFTQSKRVRSCLARKNSHVSKLMAISDLHAGMRQINMSARVLEVCKPHSIITRFGSPGVLANSLIGDGTGTMRLVLWGEQIGSVSVGDAVHIMNARVLSFRGEKQLQIGKTGTLRVEKERPILV